MNRFIENLMFLLGRKMAPGAQELCYRFFVPSKIVNVQVLDGESVIDSYLVRVESNYFLTYLDNSTAQPFGQVGTFGWCEPAQQVFAIHGETAQDTLWGLIEVSGSSIIGYSESNQYKLIISSVK